MRGEELKGYLAGLRHAAGMVLADAQAVENRGFAMSRAIAERMKASARGVSGTADRMEADRRFQSTVPGTGR